MTKDYGLKVMTDEELIDLAETSKMLPERRLMPTWAYLQSVKYNGLIQDGNCEQSRLIFTSVELSLIKRLYPPEAVNEKVKKHIIRMIKRARTASPEKFAQYLEMRRYGVSIEKARKNIAPIWTDQFLGSMLEKYRRPFKFKYDIDCRDADLIYNLGIDRFVELFCDRFYEPVIHR